jgi:predicted esterase
MPTRTPQKSDFPSSLTLTLTPPPPQSNKRTPPNILLLLHGLGDTHAPFINLAKSLSLPETTILTLQAPNPLPLDIPGFHWGDDINFDSRTGALDMDAGFNAVKRFLVEDIIKKVLLDKCGYQLREIMILGFGQGGMSGLVVAQELVSEGASAISGGTGELGGVISIGAAYPLSLAGRITGGKGKSRTPVLLVSGRDSDIVTDSAVKRTNDVFDFVEVHQYSRRGDTMPRSRDEMLPIMRFFGRRLRSWQGVPEGSVELS